MKILYYFKEKETLMDKWQRYHIFDELQKHDCHITVFNPLEYGTIAEANEKLLSTISKNNFDLFMTPHESCDLFIETLLEIKKIGIPTLLICFDNLVIPFNHQDICRHFDLVCLTSRETQHLFFKWGANVMVNPYAANPFYFIPQQKEEIDRIAFIGTPYGSRVNMLNTLINNKVNVSLFANATFDTKSGSQSKQRIQDYLKPAYNLMKFDIGRKIIVGALKQKFFIQEKFNWDSSYLETNPPVGLDQLSFLYSNYALSLSSTAVRNTGALRNPVHVINLRSFEIPMCGGLQICAYVDELAEYFEEDKEIIFYRTDEEFIEKTKFYLKSENETLRIKMKQAARKRAENDHSWFCRFKRVFDYFGLEYK